MTTRAGNTNQRGGRAAAAAPMRGGTSAAGTRGPRITPAAPAPSRALASHAPPPPAPVPAAPPAPVSLHSPARQLVVADDEVEGSNDGVHVEGDGSASDSAESSDSDEALPVGDDEEDDEEEDVGAHAAHHAAAAVPSVPLYAQPPRRIPRVAPASATAAAQAAHAPRAVRSARLPSIELSHSLFISGGEHGEHLEADSADDEDDASMGVRTVPSTPPLGAESATPARPARLLDAGIDAMKKNLIPGLCLQAFAATIIIIYYSSTSAQESFAGLARLKSEMGFGFSFLSTALFGGLIPWCISQGKKEYDRHKAAKFAAMTADLDLGPPAVEASVEKPSVHRIDVASVEIGEGELEHASPIASAPSAAKAESLPAAMAAPSSPSRPPIPLWADCLFYVLMWGVKGMEVDAFYRLQGLIWGNESAAFTIIAKVATDQFVYSVIWASPSILALYMWKDLAFDWRETMRRVWTRHFWLWSVPAAQLPGWAVWIPACSMIYCLPGPLQIPLFNLVLCFWCLVLSLLAAPSNSA